MAEIEIVREMKNVLGEAPMWHVAERALYWIDALKPAMHRLDTAGEIASWPLPQPIGSFVFRRAGGLVGALQNGFHGIDLDTGKVEAIVDPEPDRPGNLLNDGKCDRRGRYWCGSRDAALTHPTGALYRLDADLSCRRMDEGFIVSNGIAFSPDDRTMYFADSRAATVYAYDFDIEDGAISNRRVFVSTREIGGRPDGATVDQQGYYWCALVHGSAIGRFDPKGRLDRKIELPVKQPTMCTFGGDDLDILYVTSSVALVPEAERASQPLAGALFAIRGLGVKGLPEPLFEG
ncbi:MAG: SMP-30/gluconolactonase/LRE family protein [Hyphomicrobiales bacterium]